jgi:hypothetical protein
MMIMCSELGGVFFHSDKAEKRVAGNAYIMEGLSPEDVKARIEADVYYTSEIVSYHTSQE